MKCKKCNNNMECKDSRPHKIGRWRRYKCPECLDRITTFEAPREEMQKYLDAVNVYKKYLKLTKELMEV